MLSKISVYMLTPVYRKTGLAGIYKYIINRPTNVHLLITTKCNRRCEGCMYSDLLNEKREIKKLNQENLNTILNSPLFKNPIWVSVKGGEPLTHSGLPDIIKRLKERKVFVSLTTNADLFTREILQELRDAGLSWINISYYNDNAEMIKQIVSWAEAGVFDPQRISMHKHSRSTREISDACDFAHKVGIRHFYFGHFDDYAAEEVDVQHIQNKVAAFKELENTLRLQYDMDIEMLPDNAHGYLLGGNVRPYCYNGISYINIAPDLSLAPCCVIGPEEKWGTVGKYDEALRFKESLHSNTVPAICKRCSYLMQR